MKKTKEVERMNGRPARGFLFALLAVVLAAALCSAFFFQLLQRF